MWGCMKHIIIFHWWIDFPVCPCCNLVGQECPIYKAIKKVMTTGGYFTFNLLGIGRCRSPVESGCT